MTRLLWRRWCAGPYKPRRRAAGHPAMRALRVAGVIGWWGVPFILIDVPVIVLLAILN